jgi:hypothetical protein
MVDVLEDFRNHTQGGICCPVNAEVTVAMQGNLGEERAVHNVPPLTFMPLAHTKLKSLSSTFVDINLAQIDTSVPRKQTVNQLRPRVTPVRHN